MDRVKKLVLRLWSHFMTLTVWVSRLVKRESIRFWQSRFGAPLRFLWGLFLKTPPGKWVEAKAIEIRDRFRSAVIVYRKLMEPPPDPMMMAMTMQGEQLEIDDDPADNTGNTLLILICSFFVIGVLWAAFTELDEVVRAEGAIVPPSSIQLVQNRLPGSVVGINVKLGDRVVKGQVLFRLEDEDVVANFDDNEITREASLASVARLTAEANGHKEPEFSVALHASAPVTIKAEIELFESRRVALNGRLTILNRTVRENEIEAVAARSLVRDLTEELDILTPLVEEGHESKFRLIETRKQLTQARSTADTAELAAERARDEHGATISNFRAEAARELGEVKTRADQASARENALSGKVLHADVKSPVDGTVSAVNVKTVGAVVQAGTVLAEVVPDELALLVRARIESADIASVYPGQIAQVSLSAYDVSRYGSLEGTVVRVASNTTQEENQFPYYETMIEIPQPEFSKSEEEVTIVPGMMVVIDIIGQKRSVLSYILTPIGRATSIAFREN